MIQLKHVSKIYSADDKPVAVLSDLTFGVGKGESLFVFGPTGAGKTTLLKLLIGEEQPSSGEVQVLGQNLKHLSRRKLLFLRRQIGVIFQDLELLSKRNVLENVLLPLYINNFPGKKLNQTADIFLQLTGLAEKKGLLLSHLSSGEQRQLAVARALVNGPEIILADEPTGNLGPKLSEQIIRLLIEINQQGTTLVVFTSNEKLVKQYPRRTISLQQGRIT